MGLDNLPTAPGGSYRAATAAPGVYGTTVVTNDLIKDMSFWSTAALRASHTNQGFGSEGTLVKPKVYYIVNGSTGCAPPEVHEQGGRRAGVAAAVRQTAAPP